jgi:hypothetical protein
LLCLADARSARHHLFDLDDPYITLHSARVLLSGHDPNYDGTPPLVGATSPIELALVTLLLPFAGPGWALHLANWLGIALYALGLARLACQHRASYLHAALLTVAGLLVAETPAVLLNGMETGLAMAGIVWALVAATAPEPTRLLPLLCGLLPFLRPELALLSLLLLGYQFWRRWEAHQSVSQALRPAALDVAAAAAAAAPWVLWYWIGTGVPFPSTIEAKRDFFAQSLVPADIKEAMVVGALERFFLFVGTFGWCAALLLWTRVGRIGLLFCGVLIVAYWALFPSALFQNQQRYLYLLLPFLFYGAATWLASLREGPRFTAVCLLVAAVAQSTFTFPQRWGAFMTRRQQVTFDLRTIAAWCRGQLPAHSRLLIHDAGYLSCATEFPLTDLVGLKTPASLRDHRELTWPSGGGRRAEAIDRIARRSGAEYLIVTQEWDEGLHITAGLRGFGWKLEALNPPCKSYQVYHLTPAGGSAAAPRSTRPTSPRAPPERRQRAMPSPDHTGRPGASPRAGPPPATPGP